MKFACVFAHQDDEMRCVGTLLRLREADHEIAFVTLTAGDKGLPFQEAHGSMNAAAIRDAEMHAVATRFEAAYICLGREDGFLFDSAELRRDVIGTFRQLRPDVIFTHWTKDYNDDHQVTAKVTTDAALFTTLGSFEPSSAPLSHVPRIWYVDPGAGYGFEATHFVELGPAHVAEKAACIREHVSQMEVMRHLRGRDYADEITSADLATGARLMVGHAEAFRPCLAERRIPWPSDLPGQLTKGSASGG